MVSNQLFVDSRLQELKTGCVKRCGQGVLKDVECFICFNEVSGQDQCCFQVQCV